MNKRGLHSGEARAYFNSFDGMQAALRKDREKIGNRYIELFYAGRSENTNKRRF